MCGIMDQGGAWCILQPIVLKKCFGLFSLFSLQAVMCLLQVLILNIFAVGLSFFLIMEISMFVAILDPLFLIVFLLWISFLGSVLVVFTVGHPHLSSSHGLSLMGVDFFIVFESFGLV